MGGGWPGGRWFGVHLFTLGVVTNLILARSDHFARTLTHQGDRVWRWQLPIVNAATVAILWGIPNGAEWVVAAGATMLVAEVMRSYLVLRRLRMRSLGGRFGWIVVPTNGPMESMSSNTLTTPGSSSSPTPTDGHPGSRGQPERSRRRE
jgi:hypothetical protein